MVVAAGTEGLQKVAEALGRATRQGGGGPGAPQGGCRRNDGLTDFS